ncbi:hypothetical protein [Streptomyces laurentii]|uniref:hypothetical protein n=1 Tax=Streptomyces laurentii TaxID=39478 RepID=UPI0033D4C78E
MRDRGVDGQLQIHEIEDDGPDRARCVVRCVGGVVRTGDHLDGGRLTVERIHRYRSVTVDALTPPHAALVLLSGPGVPDLRPWLVVSTTGPRPRAPR